jgi:thiamine transporter
MPLTGVRKLTQVAMAAALAFALAVIGKAIPLRLPQGGSITLESLPVLFISLRHGFWPGCFTGSLVGLLNLLLDPFIVHPVQILLDYPLPFALLGTAACFPARPWQGVLLGNASRYLSHFLSGVIFFGSYAPEGIGVWHYSAIYNSLYILPETLLALLLVPTLLRRIPAYAQQANGS